MEYRDYMGIMEKNMEIIETMEEKMKSIGIAGFWFRVV